VRERGRGKEFPKAAGKNLRERKKNQVLRSIYIYIYMACYGMLAWTEDAHQVVVSMYGEPDPHGKN